MSQAHYKNRKIPYSMQDNKMPFDIFIIRFHHKNIEAKGT
jgi:hypothetical protein